ncbi:MAG: TolC family protein [Calditrichia bacterium]
MKREWSLNSLFIQIMALVMLIGMGSASAGQSLTLREYLDQVKNYSKDIKKAENQVKLAGTEKKAAYSLALPKIMGQAEYKRNLNDMYMYIDMPLPLPGLEGASKFKVNRDNEFSANVALTQTLFSFSVGTAITAAKQYEKLTSYIYEASYQEILTAAKKVFYQTLLLREVYEVTANSEKNAHENYLNMKQKYENGLISEFELLRAEVQWKDLQPQVSEAKRNYEVALVQFRSLAGIPVEEDAEPRGSFEPLPAMPDSLPTSLVLAKRPDFNALLWEEKLRKTNVKAKWADHLPSLSGSLIYSFSAQSDRWALDEQNNLYIAGLTLSVPIFTGFYTTSQVQKAKIELEQTRLEIQKKQDNISMELKNLWLKLKEARYRIYSAQSTIAAAEKAFAIAEKSVENGLATQLDLKDARVARDQARLNYFAAVYDYLSTYFDYQKASGRFSEMPE